jgi:hypothetical protein
LAHTAKDWLGHAECKKSCDANPSCNMVLYNDANGRCHMTKHTRLPTKCDDETRAWTYWKPLETPENETQLLNQALKAFHNEHQLPDGSAVYGMLFHKTAPAIHEFGACVDSSKVNISGATEQHTVLRDVRIRQLHVRTDNVVMVNSADSVGVRGPAGDVVQLLRTSSCDPACDSLLGVAYEGNVLTDAQIALQVLKNAAQKQLNMSDQELFTYFGGTAIPEVVVNWASEWHGSLASLFCTTRTQCIEALKFEAEQRGKSLKWLLDSKYNATSLVEAARHLANQHLSFVCGKDSMAHANKGAVGVRMEFVNGISISNLSISDIENVAQDAHSICQAKGDAYLGSDARGVTISVAKNIELGQGISVDGIKSGNGKAFGIEVREATGGMDFAADVTHVHGNEGSMELAVLSDEYVSGKYVLKKVRAFE